MSPLPPQHEITRLLVRWSEGSREALNELYPLVYDELRRIAHGYMRRERSGHTLQTTALVGEAYLRLVDQNRVRWNDRAHFFAIAAQIMRRVLVDYARAHRFQKRGGGAAPLSLDEVAPVARESGGRLVALDEALTRLADIDPVRARVVELKFFGGLSNEEVASVLGVHPNTVIRYWNLARGWLRKELGGA